MAVDAAVARAPYASDPGTSRGRLHCEPTSPTRNAFRRDCDRIIHSTAFRRLAYKTARSPARSVSMKIFQRRWLLPMISAIRRSAMPASGRSIAAWPPTADLITMRSR
jgi:hypothetical protein